MNATPRSTLEAINAARPIVARLGASGDKEDVAADIIEAWTSVETGLRSLVGGTALAGQALIRELRQRQFLSFEQANVLAEFHAASERAGRTNYTPTDADVHTVRDAFLKLEAGLMATPGTGTPPPATAPVTTAAPTQTAAPVLVATPRTRPAWVIPVVALVVIAAALGIGWFAMNSRSGSGSMDDGIAAFKGGRVEAAEGAFHKAASDAPSDPMPHVYLSRIERNRGNLSNANAEAVKAVQLGPENPTALRELASTLFAQQNYDGARTFYIRALRADGNDRTSQGFLGCSLVRLGRVDEGMKWMQRAGSGLWTSCAPGAAGAPASLPGAVSPNPAVPMTVQRP